MTPETDELIPVEAKETQPADELRDELLPRFGEEDEQELYDDIAADFKAAIEDRSDWEKNLETWEKQYHGILPTKTYPWVGCSNFNVPLTMLGVETLKPRLTEAVLAADPPIFVRPIESTDEEAAEIAELFLNWQIRTEINLAPLVVETAHLFCLPGTVIAKIFWKHERRKTRAIREFPASQSLESIITTLMEGQVPIEPLEKIGPLEWEGRVQAEPTPRSVRFKFHVLEATIQVLVETEKVIYDAPWVEAIDAKDFIMPARGQSLQRLPWFSHRLWLSPDELRHKVKLGRFYKDRVEELLEAAEPSGDDSQLDATGIRDVRATVQGVEAQGSSNVLLDQYPILETYKRYDVDDDGFEEEVIVWTCEHLPGKILGWDYLDNLYAHGKRPFVAGYFLKLPFQTYGLSFAQIIKGIQDEINAVHNQRMDYGTIQNLPMYFYRTTASGNPTRYPVRPGEGIPYDGDPSKDIFMPRWSGSPAWGQAEEGILYQHYERLTGLTDLTLGRQSNRVGATRTASGTSSLLAEAGLRFKTPMEAFQAFWQEIFEHILALDQQYLPPGKEFRVTGRWPERIRMATREDIAGRFNLRLSTTTETLNKAVMREDATVRLQLMQSQLMLSSGLSGLKGLYKTARAYLKAYGDPDPDSTLEVPRAQLVRTPEEELAILVSGGEIHPSPAENAGLHLQTHMQDLQDPIKRQVLGPDGIRKLEAHISETIQVVQGMAMAQMAGPAGGVGPQAMNAQTGAMAPDRPSPQALTQGPTGGGGYAG